MTERQRSSGRRAGKKPNTRSVVGAQTAVSVLLLLAAVVIRYAGVPWYAAARGQASAAVNQNVTVSGVKEALANLGSRLKLEESSAVSRTPSGSSGASSAVSSASSAAKPASSAASSGKSSSAASSRAVSSAESSKAVSSAGNGMGGEDIAASSGTSVLPTAAPAGTSFAPVRLSMMPCLPLTGRITSVFGWRVNPITKKISFHTGVDIAVAEGTPVAAVLPGTVAETGVSDAYGNYVLMDNGGGVTTFYGHCASILAPKGAKLRAGETVARSGSTGWSTGPHLHFELRVNNIRVNPAWVLKLNEKQTVSPAN